MIEAKLSSQGSGIDALILAAGSSTRLGQPKQLVRVGNRTLLRQAVMHALASDCERVSVVVGANKQQIIKGIDDLNIEIVHNEEWAEGMASSIRTGINKILNSDNLSRGVLIILVDQYRIGSVHFNLMIAEFEKHNCIIATEYAHILGVPSLFPVQYFNELLQLKGDVGARHLLKKFSKHVVGVRCPEANLDLDCVDDLIELTKS